MSGSNRTIENESPVVDKTAYSGQNTNNQQYKQQPPSGAPTPIMEMLNITGANNVGGNQKKYTDDIRCSLDSNVVTKQIKSISVNYGSTVGQMYYVEKKHTNEIVCVLLVFNEGVQLVDYQSNNNTYFSMNQPQAYQRSNLDNIDNDNTIVRMIDSFKYGYKLENPQSTITNVRLLKMVDIRTVDTVDQQGQSRGPVMATSLKRAFAPHIESSIMNITAAMLAKHYRLHVTSFDVGTLYSKLGFVYPHAVLPAADFGICIDLKPKNSNSWSNGGSDNLPETPDFLLIACKLSFVMSRDANNNPKWAPVIRITHIESQFPASGALYTAILTTTRLCMNGLWQTVLAPNKPNGIDIGLLLSNPETNEPVRVETHQQLQSYLNEYFLPKPFITIDIPVGQDRMPQLTVFLKTDGSSNNELKTMAGNFYGGSTNPAEVSEPINRAFYNYDHNELSQQQPYIRLCEEYCGYIKVQSQQPIYSTALTNGSMGAPTQYGVDTRTIDYCYLLKANPSASTDTTLRCNFATLDNSNNSALDKARVINNFEPTTEFTSKVVRVLISARFVNLLAELDSICSIEIVTPNINVAQFNNSGFGRALDPALSNFNNLMGNNMSGGGNISSWGVFSY